MSKRGPLSKIEKFYIENNFEQQSVEALANDLDRAKSVIKAYINKCPQAKTTQIKKMPVGDISSQIASNGKGAVVMTENASTMGDDLKRLTTTRTSGRPGRVTKIK